MKTQRGTPAVTRLYLLLGKDHEARRRQLSAIEAEVESAFGAPCDRIVLDAEEAPLELIGEVIETTPLFPGPRLLWIQHMDRAPGELQNYLAEHLPPLAEQTVVVLSADSLDSRLKAFQALREKARILRLDPPPSRDIPEWIVQHARSLGFRMSREGAELLHALVGEDTTALATELEKLAVHGHPSRPMDPRLVEELASRSLPWAEEHAVFQLVDAVVEGRAAEAYRLLRRMRAVGKPPLLILHMLARQYRLLAAACGRPGMSAEELAQAMDVRLYPARKVLAQARFTNLAQVVAGLEAILEADLQMKTTSGDEGLILEMLIGRLTAPPAERATPVRPLR